MCERERARAREREREEVEEYAHTHTHTHTHRLLDALLMLMLVTDPSWYILKIAVSLHICIYILCILKIAVSLLLFTEFTRP